MHGKGRSGEVQSPSGRWSKPRPMLQKLCHSSHLGDRGNGAMASHSAMFTTASLLPQIEPLSQVASGSLARTLGGQTHVRANRQARVGHGRDDKHVAFRTSHNVFGDAAEHYPLHTRSLVRSDDDEVSIMQLCAQG